MAKLSLIQIIIIFCFGLQGVLAQDRSTESNLIDQAQTLALNIQKVERTTDRRTRERLENQIRKTTRQLKKQPQAVAHFKQVLNKTPNYMTHSSVAYAIAVMEPDEVSFAVEELLKQMNRMAFANLGIAESLIRAIGPPAVPALRTHLTNAKVIHLLGTMGEKANEAVPDLITILGTKNIEVATALVQIGSQEGILAAKPVLLQTVKDPNNPRTKAAIIALRELGPRAKESIPLVRKAFQSNNADTRLHAALALVDMGDVNFSSNALRELIKEKNLHGRDLAIRKLGSLGPEAKIATPELIQLLTDRKDIRYGDRALAAIALSKIDPNNDNFLKALQQVQREPELRARLTKEGLLPK